MKDIDMDAVRSRILRLIDAHGETKSQFAEIVGVSRPMVSRWFSGDKDSFASPKNIVKIAKHYNVSVDYLLGTNISNESNDPDLAEYLIELKNRPEMRSLFKISKGATKEDVEKAIKIIEALKK